MKRKFVDNYSRGETFMKKILLSLLILILSLSMLSACKATIGSGTGNLGADEVEESDSPMDKQTESQFVDEDEESELSTKKMDGSFFVGTWVAESEKAEFMYGNVTITINEDGTWDGNITDEEIHGTWTRSGDGIRLDSEVIPFNMVYTKNNNVVLQETDDAVRIVLTKQ